MDRPRSAKRTIGVKPQFGRARHLRALAVMLFFVVGWARFRYVLRSPARVPTVLLQAATLDRPHHYNPGDLSPRSTAFLRLEEFERALDSSVEAGHEVVFFFATRGWASAWGSFRDRLFLDALFIQHPAGRVFMVATTDHKPSPALLDSYTSRGYQLRAVHIPASQLLESGWWLTAANREWLRQHCQSAADSKYFYTHLSDYLRFFFLYRFGGLYTDSDSIFLRRMPAGEVVGLDWAGEGSGDGPEWFIDPPKRMYVPPGVVRLPGGSLIAKRALRAFNPSLYDPACFNCVGPKAFGESVLECARGPSCNLTVLPQHLLYPVAYSQVDSFFRADGVGNAATHVSALMRRSVAIHLFGGVSGRLLAEEGSVVAVLLDRLNLGSQPSGACRFGGASVVIGKGSVSEAISFTGANAVFVAGCFEASEAVEFRAVTDRGLLRVGHGKASGLIIYSAKSVADVNDAISKLRFHPEAAAPCEASPLARVRLEVRSRSIRLSSVELSVGPIQRLVSVITHTSGRAPVAKQLYDSVQHFFPGMPVLVSDDSAGPSPSGRPLFGDCMRWEEVPNDAGLSLGRNSLVEAAKTDFVYVIDDDFVFNERSHIDLLLEELILTGFDVASAKIPRDIATNSDFRGIIREDRSELRLLLRTGNYGRAPGGSCIAVDFTPNVFLGRRSALQRSPWDPQLKLGEHEDFFYRAKKAGLQVASCDDVEVVHNKVQWERPVMRLRGGHSVNDDAYSEKRRRVHGFLTAMLRKHGFRVLDSLGWIAARVSV